MPSKTTRALIVALTIVGALTFMTMPAHATSVSRVMAINDQIVDDLNAMSDAGHTSDYDGMGTACASLNIDAALALSYTKPASLPRSAWRHMRLAWHGQLDAGAICEEGIDEMDAAKLREASSLLEGSTAHLEAATAILQDS